MAPNETGNDTPEDGGREASETGSAVAEGANEAPKKRFISGLVLDRDLSPRTRLSSNHVRQLAEAIKAGATLPPIVVEKETSRVVDGFHRVEAHRRVYGREALVEAEERYYADEGELFLDAVRLNAAHGSRLASYDQLRCVSIAERLSIDPSRMAGALSVRPSYVGELSAKRTGTDLSTSMPVPLKRTIEHMRGRPLTPEQIEVNAKLGGQSQTFYLGQINLLAEADLFDLEDPRVRAGLRRLESNLGRLDFSERAV